jgi:hypothetical protein
MDTRPGGRGAEAASLPTFFGKNKIDKERKYTKYY